MADMARFMRGDSWSALPSLSARASFGGHHCAAVELAAAMQVHMRKVKFRNSFNDSMDHKRTRATPLDRWRISEQTTHYQQAGSTQAQTASPC